MGFDDVLNRLLRDERSELVPILYIIEVVLILDDLNLFKEDIDYEQF